MAKIDLQIQRLADSQEDMRGDFKDHQDADKEAFHAINEKLDLIRTDQGYIMAGLRIVGFIGVTLWAAIKLWWERR